MMKKHILIIILFTIHTQFVYAWGATGHRVVGEVASQNISKKEHKKILRLLNHQSIATVATYADDIKSDDRYKYLYTWHYVNFPFGEKYDSLQRNPKGDLIYGINKCIEVIKSDTGTEDDKAFYLKLLIHFVGDAHMPLHVGRAEDKGGNDIKVEWFREPSNLHRVWDENMIDHYGMSYTELTNDLPYVTKEEKKQIQQGTLMDWIYESQVLAQEVYASAQNGDKLWYPYQYHHFGTVKQQLQKGGLRLAKILKELF